MKALRKFRVELLLFAALCFSCAYAVSTEECDGIPSIYEMKLWLFGGQCNVSNQ